MTFTRLNELSRDWRRDVRLSRRVPTEIVDFRPWSQVSHVDYSWKERLGFNAQPVAMKEAV